MALELNKMYEELVLLVRNSRGDGQVSAQSVRLAAIHWRVLMVFTASTHSQAACSKVICFPFFFHEVKKRGGVDGIPGPDGPSSKLAPIDGYWC